MKCTQIGERGRRRREGEGVGKQRNKRIEKAAERKKAIPML